MNSTILLIYLTAVSQNFDPRLAISVAFVESGFNSDAVGKSGDTGLFQVVYYNVPETQEELFNPETNTLVGLRLLRQAKRNCRDLGDNWPVCYNRGVVGGKKLKNPETDSYLAKVQKVRNCLADYNYRDFLNHKTERCFK